MRERAVDQPGQAGEQTRGRWQRRFTAGWSLDDIAFARAALSAPSTGIRLSEHEHQFFGELGIPHDLPAGVELLTVDESVTAVHLITHGAVGLLGASDGRHPLLSLALSGQASFAFVPLLHDRSPWSAVTLTRVTVFTVPSEAFLAQVQRAWIDRWTSRALLRLAEIGRCSALFENDGVSAQVSGVLLRQGRPVSLRTARQALQRLLDLTPEQIDHALDDLLQTDVLRVLDDGDVQVVTGPMDSAAVRFGQCGAAFAD